MFRSNEQFIAHETATGVRLIHVALLGGILLGGTLLRVHALGKTSYWYDEICSVLYARGETDVIFDIPQGYFEHAPALASSPGTKPWIDVWRGFDTTPPLYPTLLRIWWQVFGQGEIAGRSLSVTLSVLTIAVLFDFGRILLSPAVALWACALCAASPPMVLYAQEARSYAMVSLIGLLVCDVALRILRFGGSLRRYFLLWALCAAALLTHHFVAGGIAAVALFGLIALRGRVRIFMVFAVAAACIVELWAVPVLMHHAQSVSAGLDWLVEPRDQLFFNTVLRIAWLPVDYLILPMDDRSIALIPAILIFILPLFFNKQRPGLLLAGLWPIGIIGLIAVSDLWLGHGALGYVRYTLAASPMVFISFVAIADLAGKGWRHAMPALALAGALLAVPQSYNDEAWLKPETRELVRDIQDHARAGDILVCGSHQNMGLFSAGLGYMGIDFYAGPLPYAVAILEAPADEAMRRAIWSHKRVWLAKSFDDMTPTSQFSPIAYLGPCKLTAMGGMHLFAGRLFLVEQIR